MQCKEAKKAFEVLTSKRSKALHKAKFLDSRLNELQGLIEGAGAENNYLLVIRLSKELADNQQEIKRLDSQIASLQGQFNFLRG